MRPVTHIVAIVLGIAAPVIFTLWSTTDYGPRSRAHYERAAAMDKSAEAVVGRFVKLAIDEGKPAEAVARYYSSDTKEHGLPADGAVRADRFAERGWATPGTERRMLNKLGEKDLAVVQQLVFSKEGAPPHSEVDIFRVEDGKIVEHWEVIGVTPAAGGAAGRERQ